jgi:glycosyltransferase involved in cell wall biosynthesis
MQTNSYSKGKYSEELKKGGILFIVQLPPPVHGASVMNSMVYGRMSGKTGYRCQLVRLNFAKSLNDLQKFRFRKLGRSFTVLLEICWKVLTFQPSIVYFSMVPLGTTLLRDSTYLLAVRILLPKSRKIIHLHRPGLYEFNKKYKLSWFYRFIFKGCEIIHLTESLVEHEIRPLQLKNVRVYAVPNFIEVDKVELDAGAPRMRHNILFLSNLFPHKGFIPLVKAFALLKNNFPELTLTIAGEIPNADIGGRLQETIREHCLGNSVKVLGKVSGRQKALLFRQAGIFVLPSEQEYFPLVILEALAAQTPVITSGRHNLESLFTDMHHLLFVDDLSPEGITEAVQKLLNNPELADSIALNGYQRFCELQVQSQRMMDDIFNGCADYAMQLTRP